MKEKELRKLIDNIPLEKWDLYHGVGWKTSHNSLNIILVHNYISTRIPSQDSEILLPDSGITLKGYNYLAKKLVNYIVEKQENINKLKILAL